MRHYYLELSVLQTPFHGCQTYAFHLAREMILQAPDVCFHLHFAMFGWNDRIDELFAFPNTVKHVHHGPFGRHVVPVANILRTGAQVYFLMNGNSCQVRLPVPCRTAAVLHDLRWVLYPDLYGKAFTDDYREQVRRWMRQRDRIVTVSETVKREMLDTFAVAEEKIIVAPNSTEHLTFDGPTARPAALDDGRPFIAMVNAGERRKNLRDVLPAFQLFVEQHPDDPTVLAVVGYLHDQQPVVDEFVAAHPAVGRRIRQLGYVSEAELRYVYRHARFILYPSIYEGFGIPVLEAMGQRCPTLLSDIPIFREVAADAALFTPLGRPERMAADMYRLATDDTLRQQLADRGTDRTRFYSWRESARTTLAAFADLAQ